MEYGLIGMPLGHSFSQEIHESLGWYSYELHPVEANDFAAFMEARAFRGINVTIPYKQDVIPYLDEIDPLAAQIGAVNCIVNRAGKLHGYNTDLAGMQLLAKKIGLDLRGKKVLICGTGGTSKTARTMAQAAGARCVLRLSRTAKASTGANDEGDGASDYADVITYAQAYNNHADAQIIINTTPSGMFPKNGEWAINVAAFPQLEGVLDAVYNPLETALVQQAHALGIPAEGGLYMLVAQAVVAAQRFMQGGATAVIADAASGKEAESGVCALKTAALSITPTNAPGNGSAAAITGTASAPDAPAAPTPLPHTNDELEQLCNRIFFQLERHKRNIVLVGMPGCGKSTVGKLLSQKTGRPLVDTDVLIREISGKTPAQIIGEAGEEAFRSIEAQAVREAGMKNGCVISTGGGAILRNENVATLHQNGIIYFIDRALDQLLPTIDRPLSNSADKLVQLYDERYPRYAACADITIPVTGSAESVAEAIQERHFS